MTPRTDTDREHLARAIELADRGRGRTSPNPVVGAVVVRDGVVVGRGHTQPPGQALAEGMALLADEAH